MRIKRADLLQTQSKKDTFEKIMARIKKIVTL
jgi:hypothetical protein